MISKESCEKYAEVCRLRHSRLMDIAESVMFEALEKVCHQAAKADALQRERDALRRSKEADAEVYHQLYMTLHNAGSDPYLGAMEQAKAIISERDEAVALLREAAGNARCPYCDANAFMATADRIDAFLAKLERKQ